MQLFGKVQARKVLAEKKKSFKDLKLYERAENMILKSCVWFFKTAVFPEY